MGNRPLLAREMKVEEVKVLEQPAVVNEIANLKLSPVACPLRLPVRDWYHRKQGKRTHSSGHIHDLLAVGRLQLS